MEGKPAIHVQKMDLTKSLISLNLCLQGAQGFRPGTFFDRSPLSEPIDPVALQKHVGFIIIAIKAEIVGGRLIIRDEEGLLHTKRKPVNITTRATLKDFPPSPPVTLGRGNGRRVNVVWKDVKIFIFLQVFCKFFLLFFVESLQIFLNFFLKSIMNIKIYLGPHLETIFMQDFANNTNTTSSSC